MFKNVLVGVDGRPNGRDAIALASRLTDPDGKLTLAHVHSGELRPSHAVTPGMVREEREASEKLLEKERAAADVSAELISIVAMSPGRGLHLAGRGAERRPARGRLLQPRRLRPRDARRRHARRAERRSLRGRDRLPRLRRAPRPIAKVGVAYNGSPESKAALALAKKLAAPTRATVHALEVVSIPTYAYTGLMPPAIGESIDVMLQEANERMKALPGRRGPRGVRPDRRGAGRVRRRGGHPGRSARAATAGAAPGARQHLRLPGAPRALLAARAAPRSPDRAARGPTSRRLRPRAARPETACGIREARRAHP